MENVATVDNRVKALEAFQADIRELDRANLDAVLKRALGHLQSAGLMEWYNETAWGVQDNVDENTVSELGDFWIKAAQEAIEALQELEAMGVQTDGPSVQQVVGNERG